VFKVSGHDLAQWRSQAEQAAIAIPIDGFELDWLLLELTDLDRLSLRLNNCPAEVNLKIPFAQLQTLWQQRIADRIPVQYLVGHTHWRNFTLKVSPAVLIPRPETELILDRVLDAVAQTPTLATGDWVDLGTGSGAIAIGLTDALPQARIHAVDLSPAALTIAQENAQNLGFGSRIQFYQGSWFAPINHLQGQLSGLVSNPPYIPSQEVLGLQPEVRLHEPHLALDGGQSGLESIAALAIAGTKFLQSGGFWIVEMMAGQGQQVCELLEQSGGYHNIQIHHDWAGHDRFVAATRR
jgi:release factor glutamine methyltransferase